MVAGGKLALASAAPGYFKKESDPVITGDRKVASISCIAFCHPFHGLHNIFVHNRGCARCAGLPLSFIFYPLARAQNSAGVCPRIRKINYNFAGISRLIRRPQEVKIQSSAQPQSSAMRQMIASITLAGQEAPAVTPICSSRSGFLRHAGRVRSTSFFCSRS